MLRRPLITQLSTDALYWKQNYTPPQPWFAASTTGGEIPAADSTERILVDG
ncbi:hypothetical protein N9B17_03190 [Rhodopirellula sp.]|nr:hypothetical protein [Rhodopirellula sp.]